ncbi:MAG TPA: YpdA family putative bacillithiol disulfide reductase, partial [Longimicrobiaceae bacterium]|nr:YpdA family putative bacillithiol disulfide reductase [Longimicrobiaceae bacterium]
TEGMADDQEILDIAVVGAGPCGIAVGIAARERGLSCALFDRGAVTQAMMEHPTYTTYFSGPEKLEIAGVPFTTAGDKPTRREALRYYRKVVAYFGVDVRQYEEVAAVEGSAGGFRLRTRRRDGSERVHRARNVVIATGYYDTPNRLGIPGEDLPKVVHYFKDPYPYFDQDVVVVGGGNSAADAALTVWREGARVTVVHLFDALDRGVKPWVRPDIDNRIAEGSVGALWRHKLVEVRWSEVVVESLDSGERRALPNDWVLAMTGYVPDPVLLRSLGVAIDPQTGIPAHDPATMQTNVPGVYIAGVVAAGYDANKIFIENGKLHGPLIADSAARAEDGA